MAPKILEEILITFGASALLGGVLWIFKRFRAFLATQTNARVPTNAIPTPPMMPENPYEAIANDTVVPGVPIDAATTPPMAPENQSVAIEIDDAVAEVPTNAPTMPPMVPKNPSVTVPVNNVATKVHTSAA